MKKLPYILHGSDYGIMIVSVATHELSYYPIVQELFMLIAGLYLMLANVANWKERE